MKAAPAPFIFLSYLITEILVFAMSHIRYRSWLQKDRKEIEENGEDIVLSMTVKPEEAVEASRLLRRFAEEHGISKRIAYRAALCMEEMVAYARTAEAINSVIKITDTEEHEQKITELLDREGTPLWAKELLEETGTKLSVEVMVRFKGKDEAIFTTLDDGRCIALDKNTETSKLITDNYELLRKLAKSVEYQYILNMNYTRFTF